MRTREPKMNTHAKPGDVINAWKEPDRRGKRLMCDLGEVQQQPQTRVHGDSCVHLLSDQLKPVMIVSRDWFESLGPEETGRYHASRNGDILTVRFDHTGDDDSSPGAMWRYRVLPQKVWWSDLGHLAAENVALSVWPD